MNWQHWTRRLAAAALVGTICVGGVYAAVTPEQRKELADIRADLTKVPSLLNRKKADEAEKAIADGESRLETLVKEGNVPETDATVRAIRKLLETTKANLAKQNAKAGKGGGVSFVKDVAPILSARCSGCHADDDAKGGLSLSSYASMEKGGRNGALAVAGNPARSQLVVRLVAQPPARMPKDDEPLEADEIKTITTWVQEGAKFDGEDKATALADLGKTNAKGAPLPPVQIVKATGSEKVSFINDVAPTLVNTCGGCHGGNNPRGGLSMATFETLMRGGESGRVITGGSLEESRLWRLVNADEAPVMPQGQAVITRKWHADLRTWIKEGAKFDGTDAKKPLRQLIPSEDDIKMKALAKLSPEQWAEMRKKDALEKWELTISSEEPKIVETPEFIVLGDASPERLRQISEWATEQAKSLRQTFSVKEDPIWKGKLAIFVFKERFGYEEFNQTIHRREVPREVMGHFDVNRTYENAFVVIQDLGDVPSETSPGTQVNLIEQLSGAFLQRGGGDLPDWLLRGAGLVFASKSKAGQENAYITSLKGAAAAAVRLNVTQPNQVFAEGTFSPADTGPVGYALVDFLLKQAGGPLNLGKLVARLQAGDNMDTALKTVYRSDARQLGTAFVGTLGNAPGSAKKKR